MVFQSYALYPHMTVAENIAYPLRHPERRAGGANAQGDARSPQRSRSSTCSTAVRANSRAASASAIALARAIVRDPAAFLMDEPLSNLDARLRLTMRGEIKRLCQRLGTTTLYVTHDQAEALTMADLIAVMRDGELQQVAPPHEIYDRPSNRFVATFVGNPPMNLLARFGRRGRPRSVAGARGSRFPSIARLVAGRSGDRHIGIRPEDLRIGRAGRPGCAGWRNLCRRAHGQRDPRRRARRRRAARRARQTRFQRTPSAPPSA